MKHFENYILNVIDGSAYDVELNNSHDKLVFVFETFKSEYVHKNNIHILQRDPARLFAEWIAGLPSVINIEYRNHAILDIGYLFGLLEATATEEQEDEFLNTWFYRVAREFIELYLDSHLEQILG